MEFIYIDRPHLIIIYISFFVITIHTLEISVRTLLREGSQQSQSHNNKICRNSKSQVILSRSLSFLEWVSIFFCFAKGVFTQAQSKNCMCGSDDHCYRVICMRFIFVYIPRLAIHSILLLFSSSYFAWVSLPFIS